MAEKDQKEQSYPCVWYEKFEKCHIRTTFKLKPESLVEFCAICDRLPLFKESK